MNPLTSVKGSIITGFVLAVLLIAGLHTGAFNELGLARWLHILSGITWIGLLYYFNLVQVPGMAVAAADKGGPGGAGVNKYIAPRALFWFRWGAVATWLTGAWYLAREHKFLSALTLGSGGEDHYGLVIGIGAWLGTIMLFNVWVLIWPNQKKILGIVAATDEQKAAARKVALMASRTNFVLSIPMLLCMGSALHGLPFLSQPFPGGALPPGVAAEVARALDEDIGTGDVSAALIPTGTQARATLITREAMVLCGTTWADETFRQIDASVRIQWRARDGDALLANAELCEIRGPARAILTGERCAMNFLQTLSATATVTRRHVDALAGTNCRVLDTRKTLPGLRLAQKYAVRCGGGQNLRLGLYDRVLIKENHIVAAGSIAAAIQAARRNSPGIAVEVEVETLPEFRAALAEAPDYIMLDEFSMDDMRQAVGLRNAASSNAKVEASGGVNLTTLQRIAATGVDFVSIGALTKHVHAIDLSLRFQTA